MCNFENGFILCTCSKPIIHNKNSRKNKNPIKPKEYIWSLHTYVGKVEKFEIGRYLLPDSDIKNGLTSDFVLSQLNAKNCFDFDYQPNQGDNLIINDSEYESRLEFIFLNNKWTENHYNPFDDECEIIVKGFLKKT